MLLIAGVGVGLAVSTFPDGMGPGDRSGWFLIMVGGVLGGASLVGVPLLLWERRRPPRRRFGPGKLLWFAHGTASWLLWPPIVAGRRAAQGQNPPPIDPAAAMICYFYGTPLMAVYVTAALLAGGWVGPRSRRGRKKRAPLPWRERFGLLLGLGWAMVGLYVLSMIYRDKFR